MNDIFDLFEPLYFCFLISGVAGLWIMVFSLIVEFMRPQGSSRDILGIGVLLFFISISVIAVSSRLGYKPNVLAFIITAVVTSIISIIAGIMIITPGKEESITNKEERHE